MVMLTTYILIHCVLILVFFGIILRESGEFGARPNKNWRNLFIVLALLAAGGVLLFLVPTKYNIRPDFILFWSIQPVYLLPLSAYFSFCRKRKSDLQSRKRP
jgi:hypothetical protein